MKFQGTKGRKRQIGWFPASYVKLMGGGAEKTPEKVAQSEPKKPQYRALYSYAGQHDDELAFNAGKFEVAFCFRKLLRYHMAC